MSADQLLTMSNTAVKWIVGTALVLGAIATGSAALAAVGRQAAQNLEQAQREEAEAIARQQEELAAIVKALTPKLTMAMYNKLEMGESTLGVHLLLDNNGQEASRAGRLETRIYRDGPRFIIVTFEGGQLAAKLQSGL
jgi:hypothetical protein